MSRVLFVAWAGAQDDSRCEERITSVDQLDSVLEHIELSAIRDGCIYQVDLWLADLNAEDPIMIQFLIGHPERSSLLWHEDGATMIAVQKHLTRLDTNIQCERFGRTNNIDPEFTMVTPNAVRDILSLFMLTNRRPDTLSWVEAEQD